MAGALERLREHLAEITDLRTAAAVLSWDQQTHMPPGGASRRAEVLSTLSGLIHAKFTSDETARLLDAAEPEVQGLPEDHDDRCLVRIVWRDYERERKLPTDFVAAWARDRAISVQVWRQARPANDFASFLPYLDKMAGYARRAADFYGYREHPYDALLDGYEPGMTAADVRRIFDELRPQQVALVQAIAARPAPRTNFLHRDYPPEMQGQFGLRVAADFGYDLQRGRLDLAPHPFATSFGRDDVRITTRYDRTYLPEGIFAVFHETGHALYEQNVAPALARTPLARGCSNVWHESQSRLWENIVGRSRPFWRRYFPLLRQHFPAQLGDVTADEFYAAVNRVTPSLIRTEADEVTYNLHIMLRFELELGLMEGVIRPAELPELWNSKMQEYLGVTPPDDRDGVMQDIHWSQGSFGYFPTYALGNVMAAQVWEAVQKTYPDIEDQIGRGEFGMLLGWLREHIYQHGRKFLPQELAVRATGRPLEAGPYLAYLRRKFGELYGL